MPTKSVCWALITCMIAVPAWAQIAPVDPPAEDTGQSVTEGGDYGEAAAPTDATTGDAGTVGGDSTDTVAAGRLDSPALDIVGWFQWALVWIALAAGLCAVLFKLFTLWPGAERRLVGATLIAMPPVSTFLTTAHVPAVGWLLPRDGPAISYFAIFAFWLLVALAFGMAWQTIKARTHWLTPAPDPLASKPTSRPITPDVAAARVRAADTPATPAQPATARPAAASRPDMSPAAERPGPSARSSGTPASTESIFISYRRMDSADVTGRIYDRLLQRFDRRQVFKDVDSIPLGVDFRAHLGDVVGRCSVLLAVIGPQWLRTMGPNGRRLDDSADFVRIELEAALARNIPVIPVLVGGADLPAERDLPPSLAPITYRNGIAVRSDPDFHRDMDRLIAGLESHRPG